MKRIGLLLNVSWFAAVLCVAPALGEAPKGVSSPATATHEIATTTPAAAKPLAATISLRNGTKLAGALLATELSMRTSFGLVEIPLSEVAGVRLAQEGHATTTVELHNGDSITGAVDLQKVFLQTEWGKAEVNGPDISYIMCAQGVKWISENGLAGTRWKLMDESKPDKKPAPESALKKAKTPRASQGAHGAYYFSPFDAP